MTEKERNLIRDAMMFAVKDMTGRVMREATVQSMIDDFKKAINYTHCCKSDSEQLKVCVDIPSFAYWLKDNEYETTKNSNILTKHKGKYSRTKLFRWYRDEYNL
tara:strand:+ start:299 stop:610 length:312 start_codon:yes stop_codon:yes gene_type:complete